MNDKTAKAYPTKAFFVNMITRDITFEDCILDLIDNSVDGASRSEHNPRINLDSDVNLSKYEISIVASADKFSIKDNCGGMTLDDAAEHAFSFGRRTDEKHDAYSIGVYGIGMKRAAFKLGREVLVRSTYEDDGTKHAFAVPIHVDDWLKSDDPPWDFHMEQANAWEENGVEIVVQRLTKEAQTSLENPEFVENLRRVIARDYLLYLRQGLRISVNDRPVQNILIELRKSDEFVPMRESYEDEVEDDDGLTLDDRRVSVDIVAGMAATPPENVEPDEQFDGERRFGWYVACNGRIVLASDKSAVSGWGTSNWPQWHRQYSGFIGMVLLTASNAAALPLTTTKRSVDVSSKVFLSARVRMREVTKRWIAYTNERKHAIDEAKVKEREAQVVLLQDLQIAKLTLPTLTKKPVERRANVNYSVPVSRMKQLAKGFGNINMPYREVGLNSFDYAYDELVEDE